MTLPDRSQTDADPYALLRQVMAAMPAARHLGFRIAGLAPGRAVLHLERRDELLELFGFFQGSVIGALADFAGGIAAGTLLGTGQRLMTMDYTVKLLGPAKGAMLVAEAEALGGGKSVTVTRVTLHLGDPAAPCATALVSTRTVG